MKVFIFAMLYFKVNAGPLAYAKAFLHENVFRDHPPKLVSKLKVVYRLFTFCCDYFLQLTVASGNV